MVKFFSVDWLAQSHQQERAVVHAHRPHVPCMVQPRAPTFGQSSLQAKPKAWKPPQQSENRGYQEDPRDRSSLSSCPELSGDSSGYESEAASSEGLSEGLSESLSVHDKDARQRRARTKFSAAQISKLEQLFSKHRYLDAAERLRAARRLDLTETQVRTWFQNRRMKLKREVRDLQAPRIQALQPLRYQHPPFLLPGVPQLLLRPQIPPHLLLQQQPPRFC